MTITGTGFTGATGVKFGTTTATFTVTNSTTISATAPAGTGTVDVTVIGPGGTSATSAADRFTYTAAAVAIKAVGSFTSKSGTAITTLAVSPQTVGDVLVVFAKVDTTGHTVTSISGGGVTTWTKGVQFMGSDGTDSEIWFGKVTTAGSSTITFTWSSSISGVATEYGAQEFTAGLGASTVWALDKSGTDNGASSTTVPLPGLTPAGSGELYFAYSEVANTASAGTTAGFTYDPTAAGNVVAFDSTVSAAVAPTAKQSPAGVSSGVAVLLTASA